MASVLVVGMAVIDFLFEVDAMPDKPEKFAANNAAVVGGGGGANAACAIAKLGGQAMLSARVGNDVIGRMIVADLKQEQVDCSQMLIAEQGRSSYSSVLVDKAGERQIVNFRGAGLSEDTSRIGRVKVDAVLADTRWGQGAIAAMQLAKELACPGVLDAEAPWEPKAMALASHIAFSRQGLEFKTGDLLNTADIEAGLRSVALDYPGWLAMTDGANGVYSLHNDEFAHTPATAIKVVDTLGAGDVWHGAFAYWLGCGNNEHAAVQFASAAATLKCAKAGGGRAAPDLNEVMQFMQSSEH